MRASAIVSLGASIVTIVAVMAAVAPAQAEPVYTADKLVALFSKDKAAAEAAKKMGKTRAIHWGNGLATDPAPSAETSQARVDLFVTFEFNSEKLTDKAVENLAQFATALKDPKIVGTKFEIDGHTDATGTEQYNLGLSDRRAAAVVSYLVSQGVDPATLVAKGYGKAKPRAPDPFSPENRRVETHLVE